MKKSKYFIFIIIFIIIIFIIIFLTTSNKKQIKQIQKQIKQIENQIENQNKKQNQIQNQIQNQNQNQNQIRKENIEKAILTQYTERSPLVFVPGFLASQLEHSDTDWSKFPDCNYLERTNGTLFLSLNPPPGGKCQFQLLTCNYDPINNTLNSSPSTKIKVKGDLGDISSCNCLNDSFYCGGGALGMGKPLFDALIKVGYKNKVDLFAAGYDFRLVPFGNILDYSTFTDPNNHVGHFFLQLKTIIENAYIKNLKKVILIGHSNGCKQISLFISVFRNFSNSGVIESGWVDKYISKLILIGSGIEGSPSSMKSILSGYNPGLPFGTNSSLAKLTRTIAGGICLVPIFKEAYEGDEGTFVTMVDSRTNIKTIYSVGKDNEVGTDSEIVKFLRKCAEYNDEFNTVIALYLNTLNANIRCLDDPGLETYFFNGVNCKTYNSFTYLNENFKFEKDPVIESSTLQGDGVALYPSIILNGTNYKYNGKQKIIRKWANVHTHMIFSPSQTGNIHLSILGNKDVLDSIINIVSKPLPPSTS